MAINQKSAKDSLDHDLASASTVLGLVRQGRSLDDALSQGSWDKSSRIKWLSHGACRWYPRLQCLLSLLLSKPLKRSESELENLLIVTLYALRESQTVPAIVLDNAVRASEQHLRRPWAKGLVNALCRRYLREQEALEQQLTDKGGHQAWAHPRWFVQTLEKHYPDVWQDILRANNAHPPFHLRVNGRKTTVDHYLALLAEHGHEGAPVGLHGIALSRPCPAESLPGWYEGLVSVQDVSAQKAAFYLAPQNGERVIDACAAPGGKTAHILEIAACELCAIDHDAERLVSVEKALTRLDLHGATLVAEDAGALSRWWDGRPFHRILLDAPCTATGVIRRHPDIKLLRKANDVEPLVQRQAALLRALWPALAEGGRLVYAVCSVLPEEGAEQMVRFLAETPDAVLQPEGGLQLPGSEKGGDGFYYGILEKQRT